MRARFHGSHAFAAVAVEGVVEVERGDAQIGGWDAAKQVLRLIRAVVVADAGVVSPDDEVRAAVVLANEGVEHCFSRACVAHGSR